MTTEAARLQVQEHLDAQRTPGERNRLGQFATPPALARVIATTLLDHLGDGPVRFLEPAIGSGAFFSALLDVCPRDRIASATGFEVDSRFVEAARQLWADTPLRVRGGDFATAAPPDVDELRASVILANPPYVRHHHLGRERKIDLQGRAARVVGSRVSGLTGLYVYFILLCHDWMSDGAVAAWLVPTEWMDVNYGSALKEYLCTKVELLRVHRFDATETQFGEALVSSSVVFLRKRAAVGSATCELTCGSLEKPARARRVGVRELRSARKWSRWFDEEHSVEIEGTAPAGTGVTLGDLVWVKRGIATGGNDFFVRARSEFVALGVPDRFLRPIVPSSRHLRGDTIGRGPDGYPDLPEPRALLDCDVPEMEVREKHPRLWDYLESPAGQEARKGYLTSGRSPWYLQERRPAAPVLVTYMGRGRNGGAPFRFFWNRSDATATNVYLLLLPKPELAAILSNAPEKAKLLVDFLFETGMSELTGHGRVYGGGLHKLEPKELGRLDASRLVRLLGLGHVGTPLQMSLGFDDSPLGRAEERIRGAGG